MELTVMGNADLLITLDGHTILADAFHGPVAGYPPTAPEAWAVEADCLLYTHIHGDHLDPYMASAYLARHPHTLAAGGEETLDMLASLGVPWRQLRLLRPGEALRLGALFIHAFPTRHIANPYRHTAHHSFLVEGSQRLLIAGDAAPTRANFSGRGIGRVDCVAASYLYAALESAQRMYGEDMRAGALFLLHAPPPEKMPERSYRIFQSALLERTVL